MKIYIDVGHGGNEQSMVANGLEEKNVNLAVAKRVREILINEGLTVMLSRTSDISVATSTLDPLLASALMCNNFGADYAISIHHNGFNGTVEGYDLIYSDFKPPTLSMANAIGEEFNKAGRKKHSITTRTFIDDDGTTKDYYGIMRNMNCPCVLVEPCYMDNAKEAEVLKTAKGIEDESMQISRGMLFFLGMPMPVIPNPPPVVIVSELDKFKNYLINAINDYKA